MSGPDPEAVPGAVLVKGCFGLAGRLKALIESVAYAELTGRQVFVEWRDQDYSPDGDDVFFRLFESRSIRPWPDPPPTTGIFPARWAPYLDIPVSESRKMLSAEAGGNGFEGFEIDVTEYEGGDPAIVVFKGARSKPPMMKRLRRLQSRASDPGAQVTPTVVRPSIERLDYPGLVKEVMADEITLRPEIRRTVDAFRDERFDGCVIGVHVRYTDTLVKLSNVHVALNEVLGKEPGATIFLASDNQLVTDSFKKRYSNVIARDITRSSGPTSIHRNEAPSAAALRNAIDALTDIYLLAECDYFLYCRDMGFSVLPYALSDIDESRKIAYQHRHDKISANWRFRPPSVSVLVPFCPVDDLVRCLRRLTGQRYAADAYDVTVFGDFGRWDAISLKMRFPKVRQMRGAAATALEAVRASGGNVAAVTDARFDHSENWIAEGVDQLVGTSLAGLLHNAVKGENDLRQFFLFRTMIADPGLDLPVVELAPDSAWGLRAAKLGYRHRPLAAR